MSSRSQEEQAMILKLTADQHQAVTAAGTPVRVLDEQTQTNYVLVREDVFEKLQAGNTDDLDIREAYPLMDAVAAQEGWDDADLDSYNALDPRPKS